MATITDPLTTNGNLAVTPGGAAWTQRAGVFTVSGGALVTPVAATAIATVNLGSGQQDVEVDVGAPTDAVYFRVADASNWWRWRLKGLSTQQASSYTEWWYNGTYYTNSGVLLGQLGNWGSCRPTFTDTSGIIWNLTACAQTATTRQVPSTTTVVTYQTVLDRSVAGVVTAVQTIDQPGKPSRLRVVAQGNAIQCFVPDFASNFVASASDATGAGNVHAGIGRGGADTYAAGPTGLRNFSATALINPPLAPALLNPTSGQYLDTNAAFSVNFSFDDPDAGDSMSAYSLRVRYSGLTRWLTSSGTLSATEGGTTKITATGRVGFVTVPGGLIPRGVVVNWAVKTWDLADQVGPLASEQMFNSDAAPVLVLTAPPAIVTDTSRPLLRGTTTDPDSDVIDLARAQLYMANGVADVVLGSGTVWDSDWLPVTVTGGVFSFPLGPDTGLENGTAYVVAVSVSGPSTAPSAWALRSFRLDVAGPGQPVVSLAYDVARHAVLATVGGQANQLLATQADLTAGITGWEAGNVNTSTPTGVQGIGMKVTATGPEFLVVQTTDALPTIPGVAYTDLAQFAAEGILSMGSWRLETTIYDDDGQEIAVLSSPVVTELPPVIDGDDPPPPPVPLPPAQYDLTYAATTTYANPLPLQDATVREVDLPALFVRMDITGSPPFTITRVDWAWRLVGGTFVDYRVNDTGAPYNLEGTTAGVPFSLFSADGAYEVRGRIFYSNATTADVIASFNVRKAPVAPTIPTYRIDTASGGDPFPGSTPLAGATVNANFWPHLAWTVLGLTDPVIDHVDWYYRAGTSGTWILGRALGSDVNPPWEFGADVDPAFFGASDQYQMRAVIFFEGGVLANVETVSTFTTQVPDGSTTIAGETGTGAEPRLLVNPNVAWMSVFNSATWRDAWGNASTLDAYSSQHSIATPPVTHSGTALKVVAPGTSATVSFGMDFRPKFSQLGIAAMNEGYFRHYVLFTAGFNWYEGGKLPGFSSIPASKAETYTSSGGTKVPDSWSARLLFVSGGRIKTYFYAPFGNGSIETVDANGKPRGIAKQWTTPSLTTGVWHCIEHYIKLNTPGAHNGIFRGWLNGALGCTITDMQWSSDSVPSQPINQLFFSSFFGGPTANPTTQTWYFDDFVISRGPIGLRV